MNSRTLEYFASVAELRSYHKAADHCGVSQPALSIQLKKLEEDLGVELFERNNKAVILTEAGKKILESAKKILQEVRELKKSAQAFVDPYCGELHLGAFPTLAPSIFPKLIPELKETYPNIKFHLVEEKTDDLINLLLSGKIDAAFLAEPVENPLLNFEHLYRENFLVAAPEKFKLPDEISVNELKGFNLMLLSEGHCLRDQALEFCELARMNQEINYSGSSLSTLLGMVQLGNGITLIPENSAAPLKGIHYIRIKHNPTGRKIGLFWRKSSVREDLLKEIVDDIRREIKF